MMKKSNNAYHNVYGKFICKHGKHYIYLADSLVITKQSKMWSKNRPCDEMRVIEIEKYISSVNYVDGMLYFIILKAKVLCAMMVIIVEMRC